MLTASNIQYHVDEENKVVTATISGCEYDALDTVLKSLRRQNLILNNIMTSEVVVTHDHNEEMEDPDNNALSVEFHDEYCTTCRKYLLTGKYTGTATYDNDDPNPFSVERGKEIARRRLYDAYNKDFMNVLNNIIDTFINAVNTDIAAAKNITQERINSFRYFEYYDIFKYHLNT